MPKPVQEAEVAQDADPDAPRPPKVRITIRAVTMDGKVVQGGYFAQLTLRNVHPVTVGRVVRTAILDHFGERTPQ